jgi:diamine N-acetyltransferase
MVMIKLRMLEAADLATIQNWPSYPPEFEDLDYALRSNGWLAKFRDQPDTWIYIAEQEREIIAFSILSKTNKSEAEIRIALRPDKIGLGIGNTIASMTLHAGFTEIGLSRIYLVVRKNNPRAIGLYKRIGFTECGNCVQNVNGKLVNFYAMDISRMT